MYYFHVTSSGPSYVTEEVDSTASLTYSRDFVFLHGLSYPDVISLNLTLTVDPNGHRMPGAERESSAIVLTPLCEQSIIDGYPTSTAEASRHCGASSALETQFGSSGSLLSSTSQLNLSLQLFSLSAECTDSLPFLDRCQVRASSHLSERHLPVLAVTDFAGEKSRPLPYPLRRGLGLKGAFVRP